jgi:hypothetical protein
LLNRKSRTLFSCQKRCSSLQVEMSWIFLYDIMDIGEETLWTRLVKSTVGGFLPLVVGGRVGGNLHWIVQKKRKKEQYLPCTRVRKFDSHPCMGDIRDPECKMFESSSCLFLPFLPEVRSQGEKRKRNIP